jgi:Terminase small subunit
MGFTVKQMAFINAYVADPAAGFTEAAKRAGYSKSRAPIRAAELKTNAAVMGEIRARLALKEQEKFIPALTRDGVLSDLEGIADTCRQAGPGSWQVTALLKIAEMKAKMLAMLDGTPAAADDGNPASITVRFVGVSPERQSRTIEALPPASESDSVAQSSASVESEKDNELPAQSLRRIYVSPEATGATVHCDRHGPYPSTLGVVGLRRE